MGKHPFIVEMKQDLICQKGVCLANSSYLRDYFEYKKIPIYLNSVLTRVWEDSISIKTKVEKEGVKGKNKHTIVEKSIPCDSVIYAIGYKPNPLHIKGKKTYIVGDCKEVGNLRTVIWQAYEVAMKI